MLPPCNKHGGFGPFSPLDHQLLAMSNVIAPLQVGITHSLSALKGKKNAPAFFSMISALIMSD